MLIFEGVFKQIQFYLSAVFLAHLSRRLKWAIVITACLSSGVQC